MGMDLFFYCAITTMQEQMIAYGWHRVKENALTGEELYL